MRQQFVWTAITLGTVLLLLLCIFCVVGCSSDDEELPPYNTVFGEVLTDHSGKASILRYDDGRESSITNDISQLTPDSIYRVVTRVLENETDKSVTIYGVQGVLSPMPKEYESAKVRRAPVDVITAWRSPRYINLRVAVHRGNEKVHYFGFKDNGYISYESGKRTKVYELMHDKNDDIESFAEDVFMSCPVYQLADELRPGVDSVRILVATYGDRFAYTTAY